MVAPGAAPGGGRHADAARTTRHWRPTRRVPRRRRRRPPRQRATRASTWRGMSTPLPEAVGRGGSGAARLAESTPARQRPGGTAQVPPCPTLPAGAPLSSAVSSCLLGLALSQAYPGISVPCPARGNKTSPYLCLALPRKGNKTIGQGAYRRRDHSPAGLRVPRADPASCQIVDFPIVKKWGRGENERTRKF